LNKPKRPSEIPGGLFGADRYKGDIIFSKGYDAFVKTLCIFGFYLL
jgi:hypothetical protein